MYQIDFNKPQAIHFIGIGGISMSGLAEILLKAGFRVSGSDAKKTKLTQNLEKKGARIYYGQRASNIEEAIDLVVYTAAIHPDNEEYQAVAAKGIPMITRARLLGELMKNYRHAVNVAGTHGKTTTTSMLTQVLLMAGKNPTVTVGGMLPAIGGNIWVGDDDLFVTEACEYTNSFLSFFPTMEIILNIEADHLDFFKDIHEIRDSFRKFAEKMDESGILIINSDVERLEEITNGLLCRVITFGTEAGKSDYSARDISFDQKGRPSYTLLIKGEPAGRITLGALGEHNVYNSLSVIAAALELGLSMDDIAGGLEDFTGPDRRFQKKGEIGGITIVDDYAHHPQEIAATLKAARNCPHNRIWCVFQPHTYTRTKALLDDFARVLAQADEVIVADIYAAREMNTIGVSGNDIVEKIRESGGKAYYIASFDEIETFILKNCVPGDLLITMGAGDIGKIGEKLIGE